MSVFEPTASAQLSWRLLLAIMLLAAAVRIVCLLGQPLVGADAFRFLATAELFERGESHLAVQDAYHPLPAFMFGKVHNLFKFAEPTPESSNVVAYFKQEQRHREWAAQLVNLLAGLLLVWVVIDVTRRAFPQLPAAMAGLIVACQPYVVRASADIMSDTSFLALLFLGLRQSLVVFDSKTLHARSTAALSAGGCLGLAYLCRPEALVLAPFIAALWGWKLWRSPVQLLLLYGFGLFALLLLVAPYMGILYFDEGSWLITRKKSLESLLGLGYLQAEHGGVQHAGFVSAVIDPAALWRIITRWFFASPEVMAVGTGIGLIELIRKRQLTAMHQLFGLAALAYAGLYMLLQSSSSDSSYVTKRHLLSVSLLCIPFTVSGVFGFADWVRPFMPSSWGKYVLKGVLICSLVAVGVKALAPQRQNQLGQRKAAEFILANGGTGQVVYSTREKVAYYSGSELRSFGPSVVIQDQLSSLPRAWFVFYLRDQIDALSLVPEDKGALELIASFPNQQGDDSRTIRIYLWTGQQ